MHRISLDTADAAVRDFIQSLPILPEGVELELEGRVICSVLPASAFSQAEKAGLLERGRELVLRSRERSRSVPEEVIEEEVGRAIDEVRRRDAR